MESCSVKENPEKVGYWIVEDDHPWRDILRCSVCNKSINCFNFGKGFKKQFKYCPYCGVQMNSQEEEAL